MIFGVCTIVSMGAPAQRAAIRGFIAAVFSGRSGICRHKKGLCLYKLFLQSKGMLSINVNRGHAAMLKLILIVLSFIFGILSIRHLRTFDVHEKEPFGKMLAVTLWGGAVSVVLSLFLYTILQESGIDIRSGIPFSYFFVGFVEEAAKLAALFLCWLIIRNEMDEPADGLIYMACVALGFSLIENYFYAARNPSTTLLIAIRLIICTPMHIAFSILMGLSYFRAMRHRGGWGALLPAYAAASVYHALYDIFVSFWLLLPGLYLIVTGAYRWMYRLLGYTAAASPYRQSLAAFIHTFESPIIEEGIECLDCGSKAPKRTYEKGRIRVQQCDICGAFVCCVQSLCQIVHQYGSVFGSLKKRIRPLSRARKHICVLMEANRIDRKKRIACFQLDALNGVLEAMSRSVIERAERRWWCRRVNRADSGSRCDGRRGS
jgi:RsiW-degrading membrane proteinase PrsW (M82 family)